MGLQRNGKLGKILVRQRQAIWWQNPRFRHRSGQRQSTASFHAARSILILQGELCSDISRKNNAIVLLPVGGVSSPSGRLIVNTPSLLPHRVPADRHSGGMTLPKDRA